MVYKIKLSDGKIINCKYDSVEIMFAETESEGMKVVEYWVIT